MRRFASNIFKKHKPVPLGRWNTSNAERNAELANQSPKKMRRFASNIFKKHKPVPLGRWNTSNAERNAELANHDHCGGPQCSKVELTQYYDNSMDIAVCALQSFQLYPSKK